MTLHISYRRGASAVKSAAKASSAPPRCPRTCSSTRTRGPTRASTAGRGSTKSQTWRNTRSSTQVRHKVQKKKKKKSNAPPCVKMAPRWHSVISFLPQGRSRTSARCAGRPSVRAPTSSRIAGNTRASNRSAVTSAGKASRGKWTCGGTRRRSTDTNELISMLQREILHFFFNLCTEHMDAGVYLYCYLLHWPLIVLLNVVHYLASDFLVDFMIINIYLWSVFLHDY